MPLSKMYHIEDFSLKQLILFFKLVHAVKVRRIVNFFIICFSWLSPFIHYLIFILVQ